MIITHATNGQGHARVYLGGKSSIEAWIEPAADRVAWTFHLGESFSGAPISDADKRACASLTLLKLSELLSVAPSDLSSVPYERIAALHTADPFLNSRIPASKRPNMDFAFVAAAPHMTRPAGMDTAHRYARGCR